MVGAEPGSKATAARRRGRGRRWVMEASREGHPRGPDGLSEGAHHYWQTLLNGPQEQGSILAPFPPF
jgi:hypothetical protein